MIDAVVVPLVVPVPPEHAFRAFVGEFGRWWPKAYTWSGDDLQHVWIEPRVGGFCHEIGPHGFRCDWGRVVEFEPPSRLGLLWQISPTRAPEPSPERASRVTVTFGPQPDDSTRCTLEHDRFENHGEGAAGYRDAMASEKGWPWILTRFTAWMEAHR